MMGESLGLLRAPFDESAAEYDSSFTGTQLGTCLRAMVWQRLDAVFGHGSRVLEIGCGTGEDAVHLARRGVKVVATDASEAMLKLAAEKADSAGCAARIEFRCVPMERLGVELAAERFDGTCSNFGAVNCTPRLDDVIAQIAPLLKPNAWLVWIVMGRHVPWEWAWFLARGEPRKAFRRLGKAGASWRGMQIHYPTPTELARMLSPHFAPIHRRALGLVLPPSYASAWLERRPRLAGALTRLERGAQRWQPLAAVADHYIMEARRVPASPDIVRAPPQAGGYAR